MKSRTVVFLLVAIAGACGWLLGRRHITYAEPGVPLAWVTPPPGGVAPPQPLAPSPGQSPLAPPAPGGKLAANHAALTPAMVEHIRSMMLQEVALRYSPYFAKAHLPNDKAKLLLDLLVDQWTSGLEPGIQKGPSGEDPAAADIRMIKDLIGEDGYRDLQSMGRDYAAAQTAAETLGAVEKAAGRVAPELRPAVEAALATIDPAAGTGDLVTSGAEPTAEVQRQLREKQAAVLQAALDKIGTGMTAAQQQALTAYVNGKTETSIEFAIMIWKANHPKG